MLLRLHCSSSLSRRLSLLSIVWNSIDTIGVNIMSYDVAASRMNAFLIIVSCFARMLSLSRNCCSFVPVNAKKLYISNRSMCSMVGNDPVMRNSSWAETNSQACSFLSGFISF